MSVKFIVCVQCLFCISFEQRTKTINRSNPFHHTYRIGVKWVIVAQRNYLVGCEVSVNLYAGEMVSTGCGKIWEIFEFSEFWWS